MDWFNNKHYHSGLNFLTPNSRHSGGENKIIEHRKKVYESALNLYPQRFNKGIRNWNAPKKVALNPTDEIKTELKQESDIELLEYYEYVDINVKKYLYDNYLDKHRL